MLSRLSFSLLLVAAFQQISSAQEPKKPELTPIVPVELKRKEPVEYNAEIEPIFRAKCFVCHSGNVTEGKFDMTSHPNVMKGGSKRGAAIIIPGKAEESFLYRACARLQKPIMPPKSEEPLTPQEVALIKAWIDAGAKPPTTVRLKETIVVNLPPLPVKPVKAVAVSPDGKLVAASRGNQIHLFDGKKGDYLKTLLDPELKTVDGKAVKAAHISLVESLAFSPDGKTLASGTFQGLTLWEIEQGKPTARVAGFADRVCCIAFSVDGKSFATGGGAATEDGEIKVFDKSGKLLTEIKNGHSDSVYAVAFSPDGKLLATGGADKFVKVFELPTEPGQPAKFIKAFEGHTHHVMGVGWTADGKKLASGAADNFVKVWDYEKGEKIRDMQGHSKQVTSLNFVGKTSQFLTGSGDTSVRMWNADNGGNIRNFGGAPDFVYAVAVSTDGTVVATGCEDGVVRVYNGTNGALIKAAIPPDAEPKKEEPKKNEPKKEEPKKK